ncbi:MAG: bifunctional DNA-formamidopyrimidine glycosylase/DNA-(apurinic or apyrimidinic site) lyase [Alphaproteobacteria bacterium]
MPELPDVERYRRHLKATALGRTIAGVTVRKAKVLEVPAGRLRRALKGRRMTATRRRGKHLLAKLDDGRWLALHFGMTGRLLHFKDMADDPKYDRVRFDFADGTHLAFDDRRQLGTIGLADDADAFFRRQGLGPDALDPALREADFVAMFAARKGNVKAALMDQSLVAGVGNIFSDEILFQARIHPRAQPKALGRPGLARLYRTLRKVLKTAVARGGGSEDFTERLPRSFLIPRRVAGASCPRCRGPIRTLKFSGRTAYFCPACQQTGAPSRAKT